jgi:head-tail adaptor
VTIAGSLRERVDLLAFSDTVTESGDRVGEWLAVLANVPARVQPKRTSEITRAMRESPAPRYIAIIRFRDIGAATQLKWRGRTFKIDGEANPDERRQYLTLDLLEITDPAKG